MGKHRNEDDFSDEQLDKLWEEMVENEDEDPEDDK